MNMRDYIKMMHGFSSGCIKAEIMHTFHLGMLPLYILFISGGLLVHAKLSFSFIIDEIG